MNANPNPTRLPRHLWMLALLYTVASLIHFTHNAEYIAFYPNMPAWITREQVYLAWLCVAAIGAVGLGFALAGWRTVAAAFLAAYGAMGLDGLGHYALALCTEHTLAMNLSIGFEVVAGVVLAGAGVWFVMRRVASRLRPHATADASGTGD